MNSFKFKYFWKVMDDKIQSVFLHINRLDTVGSFENLYHIFKRDIHLKILLAECLIREKSNYKYFKAPKSLDKIGV